MKVVQGEQVEWKRALQHRVGIFHHRVLLGGTPGSADNFHVGAGRLSGTWYSPRHRHNFEQLRFALEGEADFGRDGTMKEGTIGYFPEGAFYGPQSQKEGEEAITVALQFGGASGSGYLSDAESKVGQEALKDQGEFKDGVFRRNKDVPGKRNTDSYQAIWEYMNKRPMVYPKPRYSRPFIMDPAAYDWMPVEGAPGVFEKFLGVFTERRTTASMLRLDPGARYQAKGRGIYFGIKGKGTVGTEPLQRFTAIYLDKDETAMLAAQDRVEIVNFGLPDLSGLIAERDAAAVAAE